MGLQGNRCAQAARKANRSSYDSTMTEQARATGAVQRAVTPGGWLACFVLLTCGLSGIFWVLINATQTPNPYYVLLLMWMPGCAALLTCRILRRPLSTLGLGTWNWRMS